MTKPEQGQAGGGGRAGSGCLGVVVLGAALAAVAALCLGVWLLDARRSHQLQQLKDELDNLHQRLHQLNATVTTLRKTPAKSGTAEEEVEYENQYDYDNEEEDEDEEEEGNYDDDEEYSDGNRPGQKTTVKRSGGRTEAVTSRRKRGVRGVTSEAAREQDSSNNKLENNPPEDSTISSFRKLHQALAPKAQEQKRSSDSNIRLRHGRKRPENFELEFMNQRSVEYLQSHSREMTSWDNSMLAAHFEGDTSSYRSTNHPHYHGNHILHHGEIMKAWRPAPWMAQLSMGSHFQLDDQGKLIIHKGGLYFVYAQVYYAGSHDRSGFHIVHNNSQVAQCTTTSSGDEAGKRNTCFTATVLHLQPSDRLWLSEVEGRRNTSFKNFHSFFGLIQIRPT